jgi:hypothetical protein
MQFALLIYESPEAFASRKKDEIDAYTGAWRSYYRALVDAGVYVGGDIRYKYQKLGPRYELKKESGVCRTARMLIPRSS